MSGCQSASDTPPLLSGLYWHTVKNIDYRRLLREVREPLSPLLHLAEEGCAAIESVAMDMNTAFELEVREHCPQAKVVYDLFHVIAGCCCVTRRTYRKDMRSGCQSYWQPISR
ncbi:transposase [Enterobacter sichuanensis]|uniref:Transposase n=1 Tax=Enterobacter sichuanensis TaxID=2071710 RepID=A0ABS6GHW9_9ENTR|nr:transposase [Enterobacter sichuanensis]